jgi:surfactin synthase thioesterase subunit
VALFGHSLGALWALEAASKLDPVALVTAGCHPPRPGLGIPPIISTDEQDREFCRHVLAANGIDDAEILDQLVAASVPILQADIALTLPWRAPTTTLECPITSYYGEQEPLPDRTWFEHTTSSAAQVTIPGDHFFYQTSAFALIEDLAPRLTAPPESTRRRTVSR